MAKKPSKDPYQSAGVDVHKGDALVEWLQATKSSPGKSSSKGPRTYGAAVAGIGGFAGLFRPDFRKMKDPLLIASTDGVGTKLLLGIQHNALSGLGHDLVAMCVNDLYTVGGSPLFFLDYFATGQLDTRQFKSVLASIKSACVYCSTPLLGGETAELPGLYEKGHFDLAGFVIGVVDGKCALGPEQVKAGDKLYAIASSGFHSNGYSLIRKWLSDRKKPASPALIKKIMTPTRIYREIPGLVDTLGNKSFHALANITGGGISGNLPRVIPNGMICEIDKSALPTPKWMTDFVQESGATFEDVEHVFNFGAGMIAVIGARAAASFEKAAKKASLSVNQIGSVRAGGVGEAIVRYK
jgi:phosphoribosylformylglycinamidine cyclo-ligase